MLVVIFCCAEPFLLIIYLIITYYAVFIGISVTTWFGTELNSIVVNTHVTSGTRKPFLYWLKGYIVNTQYFNPQIT